MKGVTRHLRPSTIALLAVNGGLSVLLALRLPGDVQIAGMSSTSSAHVNHTLNGDFELTDSHEDFDSISKHAIFHESREFYVAPAPAKAQEPPPNYRFGGSMSLPNQPVVAILIDNESGVRARVSSGDDVEGWTVTEIAAQHVVLEKGERTAQITSKSRANGDQQALSSASHPRGTGMTFVSAGRPESKPDARTKVLGSPSRQGSPASSGVEPSRLYRPPPTR